MSASLSSPGPPSQSPGESTPPRPRNKRARPPISCLECRRKKLRCDRVQPCMQCKKGGREALCVFVTKPSAPSLQRRPATDIISPPNSRPRSELATPNQSSAREPDEGNTGWVANSGQPATAIPVRVTEWHSNNSDQINHASSLGCIHVKGGRSRYLGLGDRMAMLGHVRSLSH
jgi:hypothetical protein